MLDIKPDVYSHSSDYFDMMIDLCEKLLKEGKAFVDDTPAEQMKQERDARQDSQNRNKCKKNMTAMLLQLPNLYFCASVY